MVSLPVLLAAFAFAFPNLTWQARSVEARAVRRTLADERKVHGDAPSEALVLAVIFTESRGKPDACANDAFGGSSRGLMQIRVPNSRCGDGKKLDLFVMATNLREGVHILTTLRQFERVRHQGAHDILEHYSGGSKTYAATVRKLETTLYEKMGTR